MQDEADGARAAAEAKPALQGWHTAAPAADQVPGKQEAHTEAPAAAALPAPQMVQPAALGVPPFVTAPS